MSKNHHNLQKKKSKLLILFAISFNLPTPQPSIEGVFIDLYKIISFLLALGSAFLKLEGRETLPFLSILLIYLDTNKSIKYGLSWDYMGVNGYVK